MTLFKTLFLKKQFTSHWEFIERLATKRFVKENLVHEALLYVSEKVEEDNWKRLRAYKGNSGIKTFLAVVSKRLFDDFSRQKFGRVRPPEWLKAQGGLWLEIYKMLCLERMEAQDVIESFNVSDGNEQNNEIVEEAIAVILSKITDCGKKGGEPINLDPQKIEENNEIHPAFYQLSPEDYYNACERVNLTEIISRVVTGDKGLPVDLEMVEPVANFKEMINLKPDEKLFLKTVYQEGISVSGAGRILGWNSNKASGKHRRIMERIRIALNDSGLINKMEDFFS